ncbi:radical SAM protein [Accumulibacter sp.]|uniref:radical SAM protein n=1 Tax=Accumulibacter sp. TaxID=2053492 RepID=UPI0025FE98CE|nr:radical SAM protein [Accumulibacter sp.]MCM8594888.1 radical SAM protein [Accumulibacter sp.]MCM8627830.1 radical SAM protein [Accumulibacter sp.]MDS4049034.1 radical SAM protein [Accumulibacter sp.]
MNGGGQLALILLPTLQCNAACSYCFERRTRDRLSLEGLRVLIERVLEYMAGRRLASLAIYWQGGEAMLLPPEWYDAAGELIGEAAAARAIEVRHLLQSNLLAYGREWNPVIERMFGNCIGSSLDYPNLHRQLRGRSPAHYDVLWRRKLDEARAAGIRVEVISLPNEATLAIGAGRFYEHLVDELGLDQIQINTPFPGGAADDPGRTIDERHHAELLRFHQDLAAIWLERGREQGVRIAPFDALLDHFSDRPAALPCFWGDNCVDRLIAIDARGHVAQCDCWVTSHPDYRFGNLFASATLAELLDGSAARRQFGERPIHLARRACIDCEYLALCHGGCPIRTFAFHGRLTETDPYCALYKALFRQMEDAAVGLARQAVAGRLAAQQSPISALA